MVPHTRHTGFTLIELVVVVALVAILSLIAVQGFLNYANEQRFRADVVEIRSQLKAARTDTLASAENRAYGVAFGTATTTVFAGAQYVPGAASNQTTNFPGLSIAPDLTDGVTELVFARLTGVPSATGTLLITNLRSGATTTIIISGTGIIDS